jgi:hypothetical protein
MKEVDIKLKLTKDHEVFIKNVTPIEALLLTSLHHKNAGGNPIEYDKDTIRDVKVIVKPAIPEKSEVVPGKLATVKVIPAVAAVAEVKDSTGKVTTPAVAAQEERMVELSAAIPERRKVVQEAVDAVTRDRTTDEEIDRLRMKYSGDKIDAVLNKIRDLPTDFDTAIQKGVNISLPSNKLSEAKL